MQRKNKKMYCNAESDAIVYDIDELKRQHLQQQRQRQQHQPDRKFVSKLNQAEQELKALRCKYNNMVSVTEDNMYLIDPSQDEDLVQEVSEIGPVESAYRINPNINDNFTKAEEQYTFEPGSAIIARRKQDLAERRKLRIYPHMFNAEDVLRRDRARQEQQRLQPSFGGVQYPIPMYFQLRSLQEPPTEQGKNLDYDLRLKTCRSNLPISNSKDLEMYQRQPQLTTNTPTPTQSRSIGGGQQVNRAIVMQKLEQDHNTLIPNNNVVHIAPSIVSRERDYSCQQVNRQRQQENAVRAQQRSWYNPTEYQVESAVIGDGCHAKKREMTPQTMSEQLIFENDINLRPLNGPKYPRDRDELTGFFELGPAIPPPNPLLLSDVPASLLMHQQAISGIKSDARLSAEHFTDVSPPNKNTKTTVFGQPVSNNPHPKMIQSENESTGEFQTARTDEERKLKQYIQLTIQQQRQALMEISDLRHIIAGLQQRLVENRALSDVFGTAGASENIDKALQAIDELRSVIHLIQARRNNALKQLEVILTKQEYGQFQTVLANTVRLMEVQVKQYHEQPAYDQVVTYTEPHFGGQNGYIMRKGFYDGARAPRSLKIGKDVQVKLYERPNRQGKSITYVGPRRIPLLPVLWDNSVAGVEILSKTGPLIDCWDAPFYQGGHVRLPEGKFDYPDVGGIRAGRLASLSIPANLEVTFYSRPNFEGEKIKFIGPQKLSFLPVDWNGKVFGVVVSQRFPGE
jgi:hypothetical protein